MSDLKKVRTGSPLVISAETFNTFIDAAQDFRDRQRGIAQSTRRDLREPDIVLVRNDSGGTIGRFGILGIDGPIIPPAQNLEEFQNRVALIGVKPQKTDHTGRFVITLGPVAAGDIGQAYAAGVCPARLNVTDETLDRLADIGDSQMTHLEVSSSGSATILWREGGTGVQWSVVRLGTPSAPPLFWAKIIRCEKAQRKAWVKRASGTLPTLSVDVGAVELECWLDYSWHREDDFVVVMSNPTGVSPPYTVIDKIPLDLREPPIGVYTGVSGNTLADFQDDPTAEVYCTG